MKRIILTFCCIFLTICTFILVLAFKTHFNLPYNSEGNYFDENSATVYKEQAVLVYGLLAIIFFGMTLLILNITIKSYKSKI
jgi:hypothetical protein